MLYEVITVLFQAPLLAFVGLLHRVVEFGEVVVTALQLLLEAALAVEVVLDFGLEGPYPLVDPGKDARRVDFVV